ncbi:hypothetical protein ACP4OV_009274 [Aristida adscensionis]
MGKERRGVTEDLSRGFGAAGLAVLAASCLGLADFDLSNGIDLDCIVVGCPDFRELSLKWCLGVTDMGISLVALNLNCKQLWYLNLSYNMSAAATGAHGDSGGQPSRRKIGNEQPGRREIRGGGVSSGNSDGYNCCAPGSHCAGAAWRPAGEWRGDGLDETGEWRCGST